MGPCGSSGRSRYPAAIATSVLLLCDAWFDLLTAHGGNDLLVSTMTALFGEIPMAILLAAIAARLLRVGAVPNGISPLSKVDDVVGFQEHHHYAEREVLDATGRCTGSGCRQLCDCLVVACCRERTGRRLP